MPPGKNFKTIRVLGDTMYLLEMAPQHGLALFLLHEDAAPTLIGEITDPSLRWGLEFVINQNYVYATFKGAGANLYIVNLAGPDLRIVHQRHFEERGESAALAANDKYLALYAGQLKVFDISNPAAPVLLTEQRLESLGEPSALAIDAGRLYASEGEDGVWIYALPSLSKE